ncbi:MAG: hypothetical protein K2X49_08040 [Acetobacteraceae bacterium]|nr:hypothetical protein [Acetobacteraceae bacterium]
MTWTGTPAIAERVDLLARRYRGAAREVLEPLVLAHHPALGRESPAEYRKMLELTAKMMLVGHACTEVGDFEFDAARQRTAALFGGCCFLADSFLDDFGPAAMADYLDRFTTLLETGWFEIRSDRERLFYVIVARLFAARDVLTPLLRQAILQLHLAQAEDVRMRLDGAGLAALTGGRRRALLRQCARDRSGHAILVLANFLVPRLTLDQVAGLFCAGALVMFIDDHGDCHADRQDGRLTYMNQISDPERALRRLFAKYTSQLLAILPAGSGRDLLLGFLTRYYRTRLAKHRQQARMGGSAWDVHE